MNVHQPPQVRTTCPYCGVGCTLSLTVQDNLSGHSQRFYRIAQLD